MNPGILDAKAELEAGGLTVKLSGEASLWICDTIQGADGIRFSNDASVLLREDDRWIAIFPAAGMLSYEVPGELQDLVPLIQGVYASYRRSGGPLKDAFARSVPDPELYLHGRPPAEDRPIPGSPTRRVQVRGRLRGKR
jgi:hypothetical protein